jgi:hypothetical protein
MTEAEWLVCRDPARLIHYAGKGNRRALRLLSVAFARSLVGRIQIGYPRTDFNHFLDTAEQFADGAIDWVQFRELAIPIRRLLPRLPGRLGGDLPREYIATLNLRLSDVFAMLTYEAIDAHWAAIIGTLDAVARDNQNPHETLERLDAILCQLARDIFGPYQHVPFDREWRTDTAVAIARGMYDSRDFSVMPILADALQDAGCYNDEILNHCRDAGVTHHRGCWVVDLALGKR